MRARALRAPVFLSSLPPPNGALRVSPPPIPAHRSFAASYLTTKNTQNLSILGRPRQGLFYFHWTAEAMRSPALFPPIAASLILPAIFWGQKYIPGATIRTNFNFIFFRFFSSLIFGSFPFVILFFFFSPFQFILILLVGLFFVFLFISSFIFNCLSYYRHAY